MEQGLTYRVASEIRAEMGRQSVTHTAIAEALGISQPQVTKRLNGAIPLSVPELELIAGRLGVPVTNFFAEPPARVAQLDAA